MVFFMTTKQANIYIPLLDEGVNVIRPTSGELIENNIFLILPTTDYDPEIESWQFPPYSIVKCVSETWESATVLVAKDLVQSSKVIAESTIPLKNKLASRSSDFFLLILSRLLIELRNMGNDQIEKAKALAYIFHNVPGTIRLNLDIESSEKLWQTIIARAEYFDLLDWITGWEQHAFEQLQHEQNNQIAKPNDLE